MTALPTKRTVKMNVKDITLVPEKATGWWCQMQRTEYYHFMSDQRLILNAKTGKAPHMIQYASTIIGKVVGKKKVNWRGTTFGFKEYYTIYPLYEHINPEIRVIFSKEEYDKKWHSDKQVLHGVGHMRFSKRNGIIRIDAKDNKYDRLYSLPAWLKFYLIDSLPVGSDK